MQGEADPVVVNTGPLIALATCGQVDLLRCLHWRVVVPNAVIAELGRGRQVSSRIAASAACPAWVEVVEPQQPISPFLRACLDEGEAAVITLALELGIRRVLIDEQRGRLAARTVGLTVSGSVAVLLRAKRAGITPAVKPCLEAMRERGIWLSERLLAVALSESGES